MAGQRRAHRVAEMIRVVIAQQLYQLADERFSLVTVTSVMLSKDLRVAKIYWVVSGGEERISEVEEAFEGARGVFRRELGKAIELKHTPELRFFYDTTLDTVAEVDRLLAQAHTDAKSNFVPEK